MKYLYAILLTLAGLPLLAQPANDECATATALPEQMSYCSGTAAFTTIDATASLDVNDYPICLDERDQLRDVWFSFTALENSVNISVTGNVDGTPGGSLNAPQFALLSGNCDGLENEGCRSPFRDPQTGQVLNGGNIIFTQLIAGETYYILVGARFGNSGTFRLCVDQFDAVPEPDSDCVTGVILCDKSSFSVDFLQGSGDVQDDILSANISCGANPVEFNSAWYKWTCDEPGDLGFTITPLGAAFNEDIDFVVFEFPSGLDECTDKTVLRQMFSGETSGNGAGNIPCLGETGLSDAAGDTSENCGCDPGDNNFLQNIVMVSGRSYGIVIMNFSGSGDGFSIEFSGSATFVGPQPAFTFSTNEVCVGEALIFEDQSTSLDEIVSREWNFGPTATPRIASGPGPHSVVFGQAGQPAVSLTIETSRACREILNQQEVNVVCCAGQFTGSAATTDVVCPADANGTIDLTAGSNFSPATLAYEWSNGETSEDLIDLPRGTYTVTVSDASACEEVFDFSVGGPPPFVLDTLITMPSCAGGVDGALTFTVFSGGQGPYVYNFDNTGFGPGNTITDLPVSVVNVVARDANGCLVENDIAVDELELELVEGSELFSEPVCTGDANATITIEVANGRPNYEYDFGGGGGFQNGNTLTGLPAGTYTVTARDANGCLGQFEVVLTEPPVIDVSLTGSGSTCFGTDDGTLTATASGGRPIYLFEWSDEAPQNLNQRSGVLPGAYTISVTDSNGCLRTETVTLQEPNEIFPVLEETTDPVCFGEAEGSFLLSATGGTPDYTYSADGEIFQQSPLLAGLLSGNYRLFVQDANGCLDSLSGSLTQPTEFIVDPGNDLSVTLGFDTILRVVSNYSPVSYGWGPDSLACLNPLCTRVRAAPVTTTLYTVVGTNPAGCKDTAQVELKVIADRPLYVPNAFSPNGDGQNDGFTVFGGPAVAEIDVLRVYDRWGGLVFENSDFLPNNPDEGWDGTVNGRAVNPAVFVYYAKVRYVNGSVVEFEGDVVVVR